MSAREQGTAEWLFARVGKITASRFKDVITRGVRGNYLADHEKYLWEVVCERVSGKPKDHYASTAMQWGTDNEGGARMRYEALTGAMVEEVGLIQHHTLPNVAGSPDGLIGEDGGFEAKCPWDSAVHLRTIIDGMPPEHMAQVQGLMWITGRLWWDFVSHDPRMPDEFALYVQRIPRDDAYILTMESEIITFDAEATVIVERLKARV